MAIAILVCLPASSALAYDFDRTLSRGARGRDVRALEIRVAGWYPRAAKRRLHVNRRFGRRTTRAVKAYQRHYGLAVDGIAGPQTFRSLRRLQDRDGSTAHFRWSEFEQHRNASCSRRANSYAGGFRGGRVGPTRVKRNVRRVMWRLEAVRAKGRSRPIEIVSGFRSVAYNRCISGATRSQHLYGTGVDVRMLRASASRLRRLARRSQIHGIECYASASHSHFDLRIENRALRGERYWWWPERDRYGRELSSDGSVCRGEKKRR
ncbi:MAG: D-Ala-D-Ala carboxypeptidase family metallohydrolase [Actinomycetota bacterium]